MKNILLNNEPILRAIEICRKGNFSMAIMFQDEITTPQRMRLLWFLGQFVTLRPLEYADLVLEYCAPDADSMVDSYKKDEIDFNYLNEFRLINFRQVSDKLDTACVNLLKVAYERLRYEPRDADIVLNVARTIAFMANSQVILVEHLAEAIHYRAFDRDLIVKDRRIWTADELYETLVTMGWRDKYTKKHWTAEFEDATPEVQQQMEAMMWGWQDAVKMFSSLLNLEPTQNLESRNPPSKSDWYICYVDGERMPLRYNQPNDFWVGVDGKTYSSKTTIWINN